MTSADATSSLPEAANLTYDQVLQRRSQASPISALWGLPGSESQALGTLNHLTPDVVRAARNEISTGQSIGLNLPLSQLSHPAAGRAKFAHDVVPLHGFPAVDDVYHINPQQSSQWDGFRHWYHTKTGLAYGGDQQPSMAAWAKRGICGRGVLVDIGRYMRKHRSDDAFDPCIGFVVELDDVLAALEGQKTEVKTGDVLLIRTGFTYRYQHQYTDEQRQFFADHVPTAGNHVTGLGQSVALLRWLWDSKFAAIASDTLSVEYFPPRDPDAILHDHLLAEWGMPMGELFELDGLAEACEQQQRWSFFFASAPFNHAEAVSSIANAVAVL